MNQVNNLKNRAPDESLCSLLIGFNVVFFAGVLLCMLIVPLQATFTNQAGGHDADSAHGDAVDLATTTSGTVEPISAVSAGNATYQMCSTCHGNEGEGNAALHAPALAGQEGWYLKRQLHKFKDGVRGTHADDTFGAQMRPMAMTLQDEAQIDAVVAYIAQLPAVYPKPTLGGDVAQGASAYMLCASCHGANAEGNAAMNAPGLQGRGISSEWAM